MAFSPITKVYLLDTPLDNTYKNQLYFSDQEHQRNYFGSSSVIKHTFHDLTYVRKDAPIRVKAYMDDLLDSNYVAYQNPNFGNKWFYAFITKFEYINPEVTDIYIETDVYQTWLEECNLKKSFVVREHVMDDSIGANLVDEALETGEYKMYSVESTGIDAIAYVIAFSDLTWYNVDYTAGNIYGHVYSGMTYVAFKESDHSALTELINDAISAGKASSIVMIFTIPECLCNNIPIGGGVLPSGDGSIAMVTEYVRDTPFSLIDGYVPKNKKLFTFPYNYLYATNGQGGNALYRFEDFENPERIKFKIHGAITPNTTVKLVPQQYKFGSDVCYEYGLSMGGFPQCSWNEDVYVSWLAQNAVNIPLSFASSGLALVTSAVVGNPIGVTGGVLGVAQELGQIYQHSIQPDQAKGSLNDGSLNVANRKQDFYVARMCIKEQFAKRIDDYFTMFGYKVNSLKVPNISGRPFWNYVKTIDVNIDGAIPTTDMRRLKQMYNDGVTFWRSSSSFLDYSKDNTL